MKILKIIYIILIVSLLSASCNRVAVNNSENPTPSPIPASSSTLPPESHPPTTKLLSPISNPLNRVTKKPFGIYISKETSPVQPEKFSGFHTGVDFEVFDNELEQDVEIFAICDGELLVKKSASGYGGVAVQACQLEGEAITVTYGHLDLSSINFLTGEKLTAGSKLGNLGKGFTVETSGERKHLHLGIHKGTSVNILGYTQKETNLKNWIDILDYLK